MSYAPDYTPGTSFADDETNNVAGRSLVKTDSLDAELADISASINALNTNQKTLQRDDGKLADSLVEPYALAEQTRALIASGGTPKGEWTPNTNYLIGEAVQKNNVAYLCVTPHNSGTVFTPNLWLAISGDGSSLNNAQAAAESAAAALISQNAAGASSVSASSSATSALASKNAASTSEINSGNSASSASVSAMNAANSAIIASNAASAAANTPVAAPTHAAPSKATPVDADEIPLIDSADSFSLKRLTWANLKAALKTYFDTLYLAANTALGRRVYQVVTFTTGAVATGSTIIPYDDTIPQITEGDQYLSVSITPIDANSTLEIDVCINLASSGIVNLTAALFEVGTSNAKAAITAVNNPANNSAILSFKHLVVAGSLSARTYTVRAGSGSSTTQTLNGVSGGRLFGGVLSSRITVKEYLP